MSNEQEPDSYNLVREIRLRELLKHMMDSDKALYEKILDTVGFAFYFNELCNLARRPIANDANLTPASVEQPKQELPTDICKNCYKPRKEHLDTGLAKNWDCPIWTGGDGGRRFELKEPEQPSEGQFELHQRNGQKCLVYKGDTICIFTKEGNSLSVEILNNLNRKGSGPSVDGELLRALKFVVKEYEDGHYDNHLSLESIHAFADVFREFIARAEGGSESKEGAEKG